MFDHCCPQCGYEFFTEEGYDASLDIIVCPNCGWCVEESLEM